jgi:deoxyribodipyrimidine photo-lyase
MKECIHIVWFKRDLRIHDHAPLHQAASRGKVLPLYVVEPDYWQLPCVSARHWRFIRQSLHELNTTLSRLGQPLVKMQGEILSVLDTLQERFEIAALYAHEENGNPWTNTRNQHVQQWCAQHGITWQEFSPCDLSAERAPAPSRLAALQTRIPQQGLPDSLGTALENDEARHCQAGGRNDALKLLGSFFRERGQHYQRDSTLALAASSNCSRLSPHLSYGTLSLREVSHKLQSTLENPELDETWQQSLQAFTTNLQARCQCLQTPIAAPTDATDFNQGYLAAWQTGMTGYPLLDAGMRALRSSGWVNFPLRALLVSFASKQLGLYGEKLAWHLAQCFTDYEPAIHYQQLQILTGNGDVKTQRLSTHLKHASALDPQGDFIRRWLPELANVPETYIHQPWAMPWSVQQQSACIIGRDYPEPIVDLRRAAHNSQMKLFD